MNCPKSFSLPISILEIVEISKQGMCVKNIIVNSNSIWTRFDLNSNSIYYMYYSIFTGAWTQPQPTNFEFVQSTVQELLTGPILLKPQHLPRHPRLLMEFMSGKLVLFP